MNILIVEDEDLAVKKLKKTLSSVDETANVVGEADSIKSTVSWLENNPTPDLILMDIELADGQSFEIFNHVQVKSPVIFITSYDEYALKAFKVNSVDYLLKPVQKEDLSLALEKYRQMKKMYAAEKETSSSISIDALVKELQQKLQQVRRYSFWLFLLLVTVLYGFLLYRINSLSQAQPSSVTVNNEARGSQSLRIDQNVIKQLQSLQDNSVSVKALFNEARNNPFQ